MALDTRAKRQSAVGNGRPWMRNTFPVTVPTESWRMDVAGLYNGNALSPAAASAVTSYFYNTMLAKT